MTNITFDGNDLQTANILTASIDHESIPVKDAKIYGFAHANRSAIPFINYPSRVIRVSGKVIGSSIADLDSRLDTFRGYFRDKDSNLDIDYNSSTRRYIATLNALSIERPGGLTFANFSAEFVCTQPFGQNTSTTSALSATGRTSATYADVHAFLGSAPFQLPVITITINSVTGGDSFLSFTNDANDQGITIVAEFAASDVIEIDCKNRTVKINGTEVDFLGAFPEFEPGSQTMDYADGFSARNFNIDVDYYPMFL